MKKILGVLFFLGLIIGIAIFIFNANKNNQESYIAKRTVTETQNSNNTSKSNDIEKKENKEETISVFGVSI